MKANVYSTDGKVVKEVELPPAFAEVVRPDLIKRAVLSEQSEQKQPKGSFPRAGLQTSARYRGAKEHYATIKNKGISRLPREVQPKGRYGKVRMIPFSVGGRRAHPPKVEKKIVELINHKEWAKARKSAVAATANVEVVKARGHAIEGKMPFVLASEWEKLGKTKVVETALRALGLGKDLARGKKGKQRTGARSRQAGIKRPKSALLVCGKESALLKSGRNIAGVDVCSVDKLKVELLAPGTHMGRLSLYTESALEEIRKW